MHATTLAANPFGLLTDPQSIIEAIERSRGAGRTTPEAGRGP